VQRDGLDDAVAFVEDAEHGNALRHRRNPRLVAAHPGRGRIADHRRRAVLLIAAAPAGGEAERACRQQ
jgi:hypothetical protein